MADERDKAGRSPGFMPWRDPRFREADAWAYLKWLKAEKAKRDAARASMEERK